jgi:hypothetical protein
MEFLPSLTRVRWGCMWWWYITAGLLVVACLVGHLTYYLPYHGRSATHFFLSRLLRSQRNPTEPDILTNGCPDWSLHFTVPDGQLPCSKQHTNWLYPESNVHSSTSHSTVLRSTLILSSHIGLHTSSDLKCSFPFRPRTKFCINFSSGIWSWQWYLVVICTSEYCNQSINQSTQHYSLPEYNVVLTDCTIHLYLITQRWCSTN